MFRIEFCNVAVNILVVKTRKIALCMFNNFVDIFTSKFINFKK